LKLGQNIFSSIEIINPGIHPQNFLSLKKTNYPSFLYLGRIQPYKNIEIALKAFTEVLPKYKDATLTIAGYGESLNLLEKMATDLKIEKSVVFTGRVTEDEKYKLLAQSWVMVQPSMIEGWGITVIEANASGTPVIASNVNGLRDSVVDGRTGLLVKPKDVFMFAKAMIDLIENKEFRERLSDDSIKWAGTFNWQNSANKFLSIINDEISRVYKFISLEKALARE
ncbi:glycosyltransferase, partial [Candidatus Daviesbacteria bacterium]|nr:glycosyltransferase [Candidatus Daviesbacteria bacterium]